MKKKVLLIFVKFIACLFLFSNQAYSQNYQLNCDFSVATTACVQQQVNVTYTGGAGNAAVFSWNFDGAVILSGEGQGPYVIKWETAGEKHLSLTINLELQTCTANRITQVVSMPQVYNMTGGGVVVAGGDGVEVGLSGSQTGVIYKLRLNGQYTGTNVTGTGLELSFGLQNVAGNYTAVARIDGSECQREMEGIAVISTSTPPESQNICMVTFDTVSNKNMVIWNKYPGQQLAYYSIYRETYQNNVFSKIADVPYTNLTVYIDSTANPLIKAYRYKLSSTNTAAVESEKSPAHKTIHLAINPGVYGYNLLWNHYEGFDFQTYRIHRKYGSGPWEVIDSVASNIDSYTDINTTLGLAYYYLEVVRMEPCHPTLKSGIYANSVTSNVAASSPLGTEEGMTPGISMFPNPVKDRLKIIITGEKSFSLQVMRSDGSIMFENRMIEQTTEFDMSAFNAGLYILKLTGENAVYVKKVLKE